MGRHIEKVQTLDTGSHIIVDVVPLKNGTTIAISDELVCICRGQDIDEDSPACADMIAPQHRQDQQGQG